MTSVNKDIVAVTDAQAATAGAIVYWKLTELTELARLSDAWCARGFSEDLLPPAISPIQALKRAMLELAGDSRKLVRPLEKKDGYALVEETAAEDDLEYFTRMVAKVGPDAELIMDPNYEYSNSLREKYEATLNHVIGGRIGSWLTALTSRCAGINLRVGSGGFYFIPEQYADTFREWAKVVNDVTMNVVHEIPAMRCEKAVSAILDAVNHEAQKELGEIASDVAEGNMGRTGLKGREKRCDALRQKLSAYADLLGPALNVIEDQLDTTKENVVAAVLALDDEVFSGGLDLPETDAA